MAFNLNANVQVERDDVGNIQHLDHFQQPFVAAGADAFGLEATVSATPQALAAQYLQEVAPLYGISPGMLPEPGGAADFADPAAGERLALAEEKEVLGTTTIAYQQTHQGLPVWKAGVSVTIQAGPARVTASQSSLHQDIALSAPDENAAYGPEALTPETVKHLLGIAAGELVINGTSRLIYRYDPARRFDPAAQTPAEESFAAGPPALPLPPLPDNIEAGQHYVVTEVLFTLPIASYGAVNWRAFIEAETGAVLYLRAFVACATGMIFRTDPLTAGGNGAATPTADAATLNPFRSATGLQGLAAANPQTLAGRFVRLVDNQAPAIAAPTAPNPPAEFFYDAPTREFAAVNAYHHCDWLFRLVEGMGFNLASYFDGTAFPVPVDASAFGDVVNAQAPGNFSGTGSGGFQFGLAGTPFPAVSIAADVRVVLHEFGHTLLWDSVHSPNFGFAHSAGDSLAAILLDPESALRDDPARRFETFPWLLPNRRHDRKVATGWAWGGANYGPFTPTDWAGYRAEQILSTTLFRLYRALGGDASDLASRQLAARRVVYLIFRAIGSLAANPFTPTSHPGVFATALMNADIGTADFEGYRGGAVHKVMRWSFERQGWYQPLGASVPVVAAGAPPHVDVYLNDGRNGEYQFQPTTGNCQDIWNRVDLAAGDGGGVHQEPVVGQANFAFARVRNRGTQHAGNVVVRGYSGDPGTGLAWPVDWTPLDTPQLAAPGGIPPGGAAVVGPLAWTPHTLGQETMFMEVSADGDLSNLDARTFFPCANGPTPWAQLLPFDNNLAQRNVAPVAA